MVTPICASWKVRLLVVLNVFLFPLSTDAQGPSATNPAGLIAYPSRASIAPVIDGVILNDPAWTEITPVEGFVQNTPDEGQPSTERTQVYIVYTNDTLYFGVVCHVTDPATIIVSDSRRDSQLRDTDSFQIIVDPFLDKQNGFVFGTNPAGIEYDGQVTNEGGGGRYGGGGFVRRSGSQQQRGSGGGFNLNWDGVWQVRTTVSEIGWTAEFAIPFRTLRYPAGVVQNWGINFQRNIRDRNEQTYWAPLPRQFDLNRLSLAGELHGLEVPPQRNLKLIPYLLGQAISRDNGKQTSVGDLGGDLKYSVTPSLTLDLTYNTDFAQVEVDDQQINLDRFNLFFPEKRPFFLENAGLFSVGQPGQIEMFFSRRIGINANGEQVPIVGGGRLSGKIGNNTNVGFLNMQTSPIGASGGTSATNFLVSRVRQDFASRSNLGAIFVNRAATGNDTKSSEFNRTYAIDGQLGLGQTGTISGFAADTDSPTNHADTHALSVIANYASERYRVSTGISEVGPNFNPEVGFYARRGYRRLDSQVRTTFRPENSRGIHEFEPHVSHYTVVDFRTGKQETQYTHFDNHLEWRNGNRLSTGVNVTREGVLTPFEIYPGVDIPIGTYDHTEGIFRFYTNRGAKFGFEVSSIAGGFFGGQRVQIRPQFNMRVGETFNAELGVDRNDISLPWGDFVTNLGLFRINYSFTTRMFLQALFQYNDRRDLWSSNIRFGVLSDANTGLFIVYNDIRYFDDLVGQRFTQLDDLGGRTLTIKYSHVFDVLR